MPTDRASRPSVLALDGWLVRPFGSFVWGEYFWDEGPNVYTWYIWYQMYQVYTLG
jgi:hypothetical protein